MKHLVKKYIRFFKVGQDVVDVLNNAPVDESKLSEFEQTKMNGYVGIVQTENNEIIQTFKYVHNDNVYLILEPDPIVIYFDTARAFHKQIKERREKLFEKLSHFGQNLHASNEHFYWYYSTVCTSVIFLFLAVEAFVNKIIKPDFEYRRPIGDKKVELYDRYQFNGRLIFSKKSR